MKAKKYIIDIDGIITTKTRWSIVDTRLRLKSMFLNMKPNWNVIKKINKLAFDGHTIILHTSRLWHDYEVTKEWLNNHNVVYDTLIMAKPLGDYYIDDKNMSIEEFLNDN